MAIDHRATAERLSAEGKLFRFGPRDAQSYRPGIHEVPKSEEFTERLVCANGQVLKVRLTPARIHVAVPDKTPGFADLPGFVRIEQYDRDLFRAVKRSNRPLFVAHDVVVEACSPALAALLREGLVVVRVWS